MGHESDRRSAERRFRGVFSHLGSVTAYARRRGSADADAIAAETMTVAWRRLSDVPSDDPRPWLYATARNLMYAERRRTVRQTDLAGSVLGPESPAYEPCELDPELGKALAGLTQIDKELLLLIAWEDLTPSQAARSLGIGSVACRVRLHRARKRLTAALRPPSAASLQITDSRCDSEGTS
jgi:RNA polymerase sigma factor (sigma-70 family)